MPMFARLRKSKSPRVSRKILREAAALSKRFLESPKALAPSPAASPASRPSSEDGGWRPQQRVIVRVSKAAGLAHDASTYAKVLVNGEWVGKTRKVPRTSHPHWSHAPFELVVDGGGPLVVTVALMEYADDETGRCAFDVRKLLRGHRPGEHVG